jgi:hypothetical protein
LVFVFVFLCILVLDLDHLSFLRFSSIFRCPFFSVWILFNKAHLNCVRWAARHDSPWSPLRQGSRDFFNQEDLDQQSEVFQFQVSNAAFPPIISWCRSEDSRRAWYLWTYITLLVSLGHKVSGFAFRRDVG